MVFMQFDLKALFENNLIKIRHTKDNTEDEKKKCCRLYLSIFRTQVDTDDLQISINSIDVVIVVDNIAYIGIVGKYQEYKSSLKT